MDITACLDVLNTRLTLIAVMLSGGSRDVVFKVGYDGCGAYAVLDAFLDMIDKGGCVNILVECRSSSKSQVVRSCKR